MRQFIITKYLKAGKGEAWAGQVRAMPDCDENSRLADFRIEENLGAAVPTGSKIEATYSLSTEISFLPK